MVGADFFEMPFQDYPSHCTSCSGNLFLASSLAAANSESKISLSSYDIKERALNFLSDLHDAQLLLELRYCCVWPTITLLPESRSHLEVILNRVILDVIPSAVFVLVVPSEIRQYFRLADVDQVFSLGVPNLIFTFV